MELTRIKRMLVPVAWTLVAALVVLQFALVIALIFGSGFVISDGTAWLPALLTLMVGLTVGWAKEGPRARPVTVAALVVSMVAVVVLLATGAVTVIRGLNITTVPWIVATQTLLVLSALTVQVLGVVVLARMLPLTARARATSASALPGSLGPGAQGRQLPVWQPDRAVGAHWHTAGAAASGAAAADWGRPGEQSGWAPGTPAVTGGEPVAGRSDAERPMDLGPQAIARRYVEGEDNLTRPHPPGTRRPPPSWTPLEGPAQPPPRD